MKGAHTSTTLTEGRGPSAIDVTRPVRPQLTLFVDANVLLELYKHYDPKLGELAKKLVSLGDAVFVTEQIVEEVDRNKVRVARDALRDALKKLKPLQASLPYGLHAHLDELLGAPAQVSAVIAKIGKSAREHLNAIAVSEDEISRELGKLYERAASPSEIAVSRARDRRERGNPPGKPSDPLGDQLSWEQLLEHLDETATLLWIVTADADFFHEGLTSSAERHLNPLLRRDLQHRVPDLEIRLQRSLAHSVNDCLEELGKAEERFSEAQLAYYDHLFEEDQKSREAWECWRDGQDVPIEDAVCVRCETTLEAALGEEQYVILEGESAYKLHLMQGEDLEVAKCEHCQGEEFDLEFHSMCSYCQQIWSNL